MSKHLTDEQIARGLKQIASVEEWMAADEHLSQCAECRERLAQAWDLTASLQRPTEVVSSKETATPAEHLTFEQLEAYVDGKSAAAEREAIQAHARACPACAEELRDLLAFKGGLVDSVQGAATGGQPWQVPPVVRWPVVLRVAAVIVIATVAAAAFWWIKKTYPGSPSVAVNRPAANHSSPPASRPDALAAEIASLETGDQRAVRQAMEQGMFVLPRTLVELGGNKERLMGESPHGSQLQVLEPVGEAVLSARPVFRWQPLKGAQSYSVVIFDRGLNLVQASPALQGSSWSPGRALKPSQVYEWQVTAKTADGNSTIAPAPPSPEAKFLVLEKTKADEIEQFQRSYPGDHLVLGILYAQAGIFTAAARELKQVPSSDANYNLAQKLLSSLRQLRPHT